MCWLWRMQAVYPRWRGEHNGMTGKAIRQRGLSPLARGTRTRHQSCGSCWRFIPAGAGNTLLVNHLHELLTVYPRWRGEHRGRAESFNVFIGLSPLARGTLTNNRDKPWSNRFIPAGAGNTRPYLTLSNVQSVYPRWRGEHANAPALGEEWQRFIPAGAGNTMWYAILYTSFSVYPRWRGEHLQQTLKRDK